MPDTVRMLPPGGGAPVEVPADEALIYADKGFTQQSNEQRAAAGVEAARDEYYSSPGAKFASGALAVARGVTGGGSDALIRTFGSEKSRRDVAALREHNGTLSTALELAGTMLPAGVGELATQAREAAGGATILGAARGAAAEGMVYGAGQGVSELALSDHPLTAEHIASTLSSNVLLGGAIGGVAGGAFKAGEKALGRAAQALETAATTRKALEGVPADLAHLDEAGLREAAAAAKAEHAADIAAERKSLEALRGEQRAELANQVRDFHAELATEKPIFQAVAEDVRNKLPGVGADIASPLNKSYRAMRAAFDNPIALAENPTSLLKPLQMQQTALENLQARMPEVQAALAGDARAAVLEHVDEALQKNRAFQDAIRTVDKSAPLTGSRLSMLEAGPSARMQAIESAREALKNAPELGLLGRGAKAGAFAGGTALAHLIPGVGFAAPFVGKAAADFVGKAMTGLAGAERAVAQKTATTIRSFLSTAEKVEPFVPRTATSVLKAVRFGPGPEPKSDKLHDLYAARSAEIRQQTYYAPDGSVQMRPEARLEMAKKLEPIRAVNPLLADKIETTAARKIAFISSKLPRKPEVGGLQIGPDNWRPSSLAMRSWARTVRACEDPAGVEDRLLHGNVTPEDGEAYRTVYPERFAAIQQAIFQAAPTLAKTLPMKRKVALSVFTGVALTPTQQPNVLAVLQGTFTTEGGSNGGMQAPQAQPNFGALGSLKSPDKPTPAQQREGA